MSMRFFVFAILGLGFGLMSCNKSTGPDAAKCPGDTTTVIMTLTAPVGLNPSVLVLGPDTFEVTLKATDTLRGVPAGNYTFEPKRIKVAGAIVGKAYYGKMTATSVMAAACVEQKVSVDYTQEPGSEKLWVADGDKIHAFSAANLGATGTHAPDLSLSVPAASNHIAFDSAGNLWLSSAEGVLKFAMEDLGNSAATPRVKLTGGGVMGKAIPGPGALAFDEKGSLWIAQVADSKIVKFDAYQLQSTSTPSPAFTIASPDVASPQSLAFDAQGNLWVASGDSNAVLEFTQAHIASNIGNAADVKIVHRSPPPVAGTITLPNNLAFDKLGNLWVTYFNSNSLIQIPAGGLGASSDTLAPAIEIKGGVLSLVEGLAIDEGGGVWMPGPAGKIVRVAPDNLTASGDLTASVILTSTAVSGANTLAFDPAPAALPIRN